MKLTYLLIIVALVIGALGVGYYQAQQAKGPAVILPYYGRYSRASIKTQDPDTIFTVPPFAFTDQNGQTVTQETFGHKIYVTDFFFTTCQSICPKMTGQMSRVAQTFADQPTVMFLSHTVTPEIDSVPVLKAYAQEQGANDARWKFVTGKRQTLYDMARYGYFVVEPKNSPDADDFIHTENFALVDGHKRIRGYYDGTDSVEVNRLIKDIRILLQEEAAH